MKTTVMVSYNYTYILCLMRIRPQIVTKVENVYVIIRRYFRLRVFETLICRKRTRQNDLQSLQYYIIDVISLWWHQATFTSDFAQFSWRILYPHKVETGCNESWWTVIIPRNRYDVIRGRTPRNRFQSAFSSTLAANRIPVFITSTRFLITTS